MLTLDSSCGCTGSFTEDATALYGVRAIYKTDRNGWHTFDLVPTYAQVVARDAEVEAEFRKNLTGDLGFINTARIMFRESQAFWEAGMECDSDYGGRPIMPEPVCIYDLGYVAFFAQQRGTYVYLTWAYYNRPLDWDACMEVASYIEVAQWLENERKRRR